MGLGAELREGEGYDGLLEGLLGILVEQPHGLGGVDGRAAADADDPIGLEGLHGLGALHNRLDGRVGLNALKDFNLETGLLEIGLNVLQETAAAHRAATGHDHGALALEVLDLMTGTLTEVQITRIGKTSHCVPPKSRVTPHSRAEPPFWLRVRTVFGCGRIARPSMMYRFIIGWQRTRRRAYCIAPRPGQPHSPAWAISGAANQKTWYHG